MHPMVFAAPRSTPMPFLLDHPELLLLDAAVVRLAARYLASHALTVGQCEALGSYRKDLETLIETLVGPTRKWAEQVLELARIVLRATSRAAGTHPAPTSGAPQAA